MDYRLKVSWGEGVTLKRWQIQHMTLFGAQEIARQEISKYTGQIECLEIIIEKEES